MARKTAFTLGPQCQAGHGIATVNDFTRQVCLFASLSLSAALYAWPSAAQTASSDARPALHLDDVSRIASTNRAEIAAAAARADALAQRPAIVGALEDPTISPSIDHYPFNMMDEEEGGQRFDWSITFEQRFPLSGLRGHRRRAAYADAARASADTERATLDVALEAQRAFFMLRERRRMRSVLDQQLALARELVTSAAARYGNGTGAQADVLRAEVETARVGAAQRALESRIKAAESMLNASMGLPAAEPIGELIYEPTFTALPSAAALQDLALSARPELRAGQAEIERALAEVEVMRSMYLPMAMIRTGPASTMAEGDGAMLMIGISVPLWRGRLRAGVAEARAMERMARADLTAMQLMIAGETTAAREEVQAAHETLRALEAEVIPRAEMAVDAALAAYASGQGTLVSVVDALGALWQTRADLVMAESVYGEACVRLERALGQIGSKDNTP
jgi:outer membrane protein TolC